jgi:hypothetical protein
MLSLLPPHLQLLYLFALLCIAILWWEVFKRNVTAWGIDGMAVRVGLTQHARVIHEWYVVRSVGRPWFIRLYDYFFFRIKGLP